MLHDAVTAFPPVLFRLALSICCCCRAQKVNPSKAPQVVGGLLDAEASDEFINNLILSVRSLIPVEQLCEEVLLFSFVQT